MCKPTVFLDEAENILQDALQGPGTRVDHCDIQPSADSCAALRLTEEECSRILESCLSRVRTAQVLQHCSISAMMSNSSTSGSALMQLAGIALKPDTAAAAGRSPMTMQ